MKKYFLLIWLISFSFIISASVWDDIASCFKDPCNCGQGDSYEEWGGNTRSFEANALCPPWNKGDGRDPGTCLLQFDYPSAFTPFYMNHCAEQTEESTYFTPKIKVRVQNCNSFACWTESTSLNWDGECTVWPTGWGFPTLRICARLALPANPLTGTPADPGYTKGVHLNSEGFEEADKIIYGIDGKAIAFDQPKVCAYRDPWLLSIIDVDGRSIIDLLDFNPVSQPLHHTAGIHPIAKIMIFLIENTSGNNMIDMLGNIFSNAGDNIAPGIGNLITKTMSIFKVVLNALDKIINFRNSLYIAVIKEFGQFNREVDNYHFGCVELPMGPYPPPFCPQIPPFVPTASVQTICPLNSSWVPTGSTVNDPCVVSNLVNNSVRNSIRVTLDNFVPLCSPTQAASGEASDKCVILDNINAAASASAMHTLTAKKDVIKPCNKAASGMPCAKTTIPFICSVSSNGCQDGFRIVYGTQVGNQLVPSGYYIDELSDCGTSKSSNCQKIWGINTGEYVDVSLVYPQTEVSADLTDLSQDFTLSYNITDAQTGNSKSNAVNLTAKIVRQSTTYSPTYNNLNQTTDMMCVITSDYLAGCTNRQPAPKVKVYDCNSDFAKSNNLFCNNNGYYTPMLIGSIQDGRGGADATSAVFEALSYKNSSTLAYQINLAGSDYLAFVTDDNYIMKPFSGSHSVNPSTIYGTYQNDDPPYYPDGTINNNAVYLTGLEYINTKYAQGPSNNGRYIQGGTNICLQNLAAIHCPSDTTNCVLSNLLNNNIVSCSDFLNKSTKYNNLRLCSKSDTNCQNIDSMPGKNGNSGIQINQCDTGFCYTNANNVEVCKQSLKPSDIYMPSENDVIKNGAYYNVNDNTVDDNSLVISSNSNNNNSSNGSLTVNNGNNTTTTYSVNNNNAGLNYNKDLYILRDKTPYELGACIGIPQPKCPAITNPGPDDGNATWPETLIGEVAQGSCVNNGTTGNGQSLTRYCLSNVDTGEIKFQPIEAGQGCKVSSINLTSVVNNVPDYVQPQTQTNTAGQSGNVQLNSDHWEDSKKLQAGEYSSKLTFNVQGVSSIDYFRITQLAYDDYVLITMNNKKIYSGPWSFNTLSYANGQALVDGSSQGSQDGFRNNNLNLDLTPYLVEGTNTIEIKAVVYDVGTIAYLIEYQMKQQ